MLAGVTIVDPATTWIEPTSSSSPTPSIHPFTILRGATSVAAGAEVGPHVGRDRRRDRARRARGPVLLPSPRHRARGAVEGRHVRGDQELAGRRGRQGAAPVLHRATRTSARTRTSAPARSPRTSRTSPGRPRAGRRSGGTSGPAVHNMFVAPVDDRRRSMDSAGIGDHRGRAPPTRSPGSRAAAGEQGRARWKAGRLS